MRHHLALSVDLVWVLSAIPAVLIRDNFVPYEPRQRLRRRQTAA